MNFMVLSHSLGCEPKTRYISPSLDLVVVKVWYRNINYFQQRRIQQKQPLGNKLNPRVFVRPGIHAFNTHPAVSHASLAFTACHIDFVINL